MITSCVRLRFPDGNNIPHHRRNTKAANSENGNYRLISRQTGETKTRPRQKNPFGGYTLRETKDKLSGILIENATREEAFSKLRFRAPRFQ